MDWFKITLQLLIGVSALLAIYLDYKWYDKRTKLFKRARNFLITTTIVSLLGSLAITTIEEKKQTIEKKQLTDNLSALRDSLATIKEIGLKLNNQIEPFLELAREKYPNLPIEQALRKLEEETKELQLKTDILEEKEITRNDKEIELVKLKRTPPDVNFELDLIDNDLLILIKFNNEVPIKISPRLHLWGPWECEDQTKKYRVFNTAMHDFMPSVIYPPKDKNKKYKFVYDKLEKSEELPKDKTLCMRMYIKYSSIYSGEINIPELKEKEISIDYLIEPYSMKFIPTKFKEE